jgi:hypothetical protein
MASALRATIAGLFIWSVVGSYAASPTDALVVGTWIAKRDFMTLRLVLRADHTLEWSIATDDRPKPHPVTGKWRIAQNDLVVRWELRDDDALIPILGTTQETLVLEYPGRTTFRRQKP